MLYVCSVLFYPTDGASLPIEILLSKLDTVSLYHTQTRMNTFPSEKQEHFCSAAGGNLPTASLSISKERLIDLKKIAIVWTRSSPIASCTVIVQ
jgi:hypothetical protein